MATNTWQAAGAANWGTAGNWSLGHVPLIGEDIVFDATGAGNCTINVDTALVGKVTISALYAGNVALGAGKTLSCHALYVNSNFDSTFGAGVLIVASADVPEIVVDCAVPVYLGNIGFVGGLVGARMALLAHAMGSDFSVMVINSASDIVLELGAGGPVAMDEMFFDPGVTVTFAASPNPVIIATYFATDWDNMVWLSGTPGSPATIVAPAGVVVVGLTATDIANAGAVIDATDPSNRNGGGTSGFDWPIIANSKSRSNMMVGCGL